MIQLMCSKMLVKPAMIVVLALLLFYGSGYVHGATGPQNTRDMLALVDFRQAITSDPRAFFDSWNNSVGYCKWNGVTCSKTHLWRVRELNLTGQNLEGQVSPSLGNLTLLKILDLSSNSLFGQLPNLNRLHTLWYLSLRNNKLQVFEPDALKNCSNLLWLDLSANKLAGSIPAKIGFLYNLEYLNLESNNFTGVIPSSLGNITKLYYLVLSDNHIEGSIPTTILNHSSLYFLDVNTNFLQMALPPTMGITLPNIVGLLLYNNMFHGQIPASLGSIPIELGSLSSLTQLDLSYNNLQCEVPRDGIFRNATAVSLVGNTGLLWRMARAPSLSPLGDQFPIVSYNGLAQATKNFSESNLIGRGSCGSVYGGNLTKNKLEVPVKVLDLDMRGAEKSFLSECQALRNIRHQNLVPIITARSTVDANGNVFKALIYEFMPNNGNLDSWLRLKGSGKARKPLSLNQRTCLAVNIADVLDYLHHESGRTIIHCDVKPSNILLDDDMNARLGDFGIAKLYLDSRSQSNGDSDTTKLHRHEVCSECCTQSLTLVSSEYARGGHASTYGDVYCFGIVLLEMLTGKRPTDHLFVNELNIVRFVERSFPDKILDLIGERTTMREAASRIRAIKSTYDGGNHKHPLK
ncbi:putative LRR receptor-like serine/threonine-protein kinase [Dichanthelium oligosanthes]|uniref:Putative LRR receptor-like serine/threonine-protein kinase n=1 Tax=Dichanthelium oligosanthes TaxID=888268 RepID=A0A1E5WIM2_9POAL|nr:putative LRR receptor-like serine/threonine-protein kinase [Dichanthelium oligosanthes]